MMEAEALATSPLSRDGQTIYKAIKIEPQYRLEQITKVSRQEARENIAVIKLETSKRFGSCAVATNGRSLAVVPVEGEHDHGLLSDEALKASRQGKYKSDLICLNGNLETNGKSFPRPEVGMFPNWEAVLPKEKAKFSVALNPKLLLELAQAIGADAVRLDFIDESSAITVTNNASSKPGFGLLMPMRIN